MTNYIISTVKIIGKPIKRNIKENLRVTICKVQLPKSKTKKIINLVIFDRLNKNLNHCYNINNYLIVEGFLSNNIINVQKSNKNSRKIKIIAKKIYPYLSYVLF